MEADSHAWFSIRTTTDEECECLSVILAFGKTPGDLGVPGEGKLMGRGVSYCAVRIEDQYRKEWKKTILRARLNLYPLNGNICTLSLSAEYTDPVPTRLRVVVVFRFQFPSRSVEGNGVEAEAALLK